MPRLIGTSWTPLEWVWSRVYGEQAWSLVPVTRLALGSTGMDLEPRSTGAALVLGFTRVDLVPGSMAKSDILFTLFSPMRELSSRGSLSQHCNAWLWGKGDASKMKLSLLASSMYLFSFPYSTQVL